MRQAAIIGGLAASFALTGLAVAGPKHPDLTGLWTGASLTN